MTPPPGVCADSRTGMGGTRADQTLTHLTVHQAQAGRVGRGDSPRRGGAGPSAAWSILRGGEPQPHERVAVLGIGTVGHLAVRFAHACGLQTIAMTISPDKHDVARRLGADEVVAKGANCAQRAAPTASKRPASRIRSGRSTGPTAGHYGCSETSPSSVRSATADAQGRLTIPLALGPGNPYQQYSPQAETSSTGPSPDDVPFHARGNSSRFNRAEVTILPR